MDTFTNFADRVNRKFQLMVNSQPLFVVDMEKEEFKSLYLNSFREGDNNLYIERTEHDCNCCHNFIRNIGAVVAIKNDYTLDTVWDIDTDGLEEKYVVVAKAMSEAIKNRNIKNIFLTKEGSYGKRETEQVTDSGKITWNHFYSGPIPYCYKTDTVAKDVGNSKTSRNVFQRGLEEVSLESIEQVLELISEDALYRGDSVKDTVTKIYKLKIKYKDSDEKDNFCWLHYADTDSHFRNSSIGTLLLDISAGTKSFEKCILSYEEKVAGPNYKRKKPVRSKAQMKKALEFIEKEGLEPSLYRRHAKITDININDVLFADRSVEKSMMGTLASKILSDFTDNDVPKDNQNIKIKDFIENVLGQTSKLELMVSNKHVGNLVSITAPQNDCSKLLFGWDNNFAWSYNGNMADSDITRKVSKAGGKVDGVCRSSLYWENTDDLDIHLIEPSGNEISFSDKYNYRTGGQLDVDMNVNGHNAVRGAVENITYPELDRMNRGKYLVQVHNYTKRERSDPGFTVELKLGEEIHTFHYRDNVSNNETVGVCEFELKTKDLKDSFEVTKVYPNVTQQSASNNVWGIDTETWVKVTTVMYSPNYWLNNESGNRHYMFMLENCKNPDKTRGFYNEYLKHNTREHRSSFEYLADKLMCDYSDEQLSGLGFSSTQRKEILCKATMKDGTIRTLNIKF